MNAGLKENRRFIFRLAVYATLALSFGEKAQSQEPPHWRFWRSPEEGLSRLTIHLTLSPNKNLLISHSLVDTNASWFDGYQVRTLPWKESRLPIYEGPNGQIWALKLEDSTGRFVGLQQYQYGNDVSKGVWIDYPIPELYALPPFDGVTVPDLPILPRDRNRILILVRDRLLEFDAATQSIRVLKHAIDTNLKRFLHIKAARDSAVWITGEQGLAKITLPAESPQGDVRWNEYCFPNELGVRDFLFPTESAQGEIFGSAYCDSTLRRVLVRFTGGGWNILYQANGEDIVAGWRCIDGALWLLKGQAQAPPISPLLAHPYLDLSLLRIEDGLECPIKKKGELTGYILDVAVEPEGSFWLAMRGVTRYAPPIWRTPQAVSDVVNEVFAIHEDPEGRMWFAERNQLVCFDNIHWKKYSYPTGIRVHGDTKYCLSTLPDGRQSVLTDRGFFMTIDPADEAAEFERVKHPEERRILAMVPRRSDDRVWVVTGTAQLSDIRVELYDGKTFVPVVREIQTSGLGKFKAVFETASGFLWLGGTGGVGILMDNEFRQYTPENGHLARAFCFEEVENGKIWSGGNGLIEEFDGQRWRVIKGGFSDTHRIRTRSDGSIWIASEAGILRQFEGSWIINTLDDGLPSSHVFDLFEDSQRRLWAATAGGISVYHPEADRDPPETYIPSDKNLAETPPGGDVRLVYSGMDRWNYTKADRLLFSHRFDKEPWSPFASNTVVSATGLSPGKHRLDVRAIDRNWNVDPTPASFEFTVLLPWYKEPVFIVIAGMGSIIILLLAGYSISRYVHLERLVTRRTEAMRKAYAQLQSLASQISFVEERERRKIATDLHDRIGHGLAACRMLLTTIQKNTQDRETAAQLDKSRELLGQTIEDTRSLTFEISPPILYSIGLEAALEWLVEQFAKQYDISFSFHDDKQPKPMGEDVRGILFRAVRELLFNVVKHANAKNARVSITHNDGNVRIDVEDDGIGFDEAVTAPGTLNRYGLLNIRERLEYLGGTFVHHPVSGHGTHITLTLPLSAHESRG